METHTTPLAGRALLRLGLLFPTRALALRTNDVLGAGKLGRLSLVELLQRHFIFLLLVPPFAWSSGSRSAVEGSRRPSTSAKEHMRQDVVEIDFSAHALPASRVKGGHAMGVVEMSLVVIIEDLVRLTDGFELDLGLLPLGLGDLVGMTGQRRLYYSLSGYVF